MKNEITIEDVLNTNKLNLDIPQDAICHIKYRLSGIDFPGTVNVVKVWLNNNEIGNIVYSHEQGEKNLELNIGAQLVNGNNILRLWTIVNKTTGPINIKADARLVVRSGNSIFIQKDYASNGGDQVFDENFTLIKA